ncbi:MAG: hypothetical protein NTV90_05635 [Actinobacteria bacterium]|nr:hypothetical protein [Actinomycetota bacterium]
MKITSRVTFKVVFLALIASLTFQPTAAQAADNCVPDKIELTKFAIHPGQSMGLVLNGQALAAPCTTADPGIVGLTYGDRANVVLESGSLTDINSWKWKDFTYEDLILMFKTAGIKQAIDAQKVLSFYFYRNVKGTIDLSNPIASLGIILDPTTAGPCHPDLVEHASDFVTPLQGTIQILNGISTPIPCTIFDPGWFGFAYVAPGATSISINRFYFDKWAWGGEITYQWVLDLLAIAKFDTSTIVKDSKIQVRYFRGGSAAVVPADIDAYTLVFELKLDPLTPAQIAAAKAAADKKIADEKAAADKIIADKAAADKVIADKAAAAAKAAAAKKITITCVKGKLTKKVTAVKPVCPSGYKKK